MATSRTPRSAEFSSSAIPNDSGKRSSFPEKRSRNTKKAKHRANVAAHARSVAKVARAIEIVKSGLLDGSPCSKLLDDFFDAVGGESAFTFELSSGPRWLVDAIARSCEEVLEILPGQSTVFLTELPEYGLIHGSVIVGDFMGAAVYFDDIRMGAVSLYPEDCVDGAYFIRLVVVDDMRRSRAAPN